MFNRRQNRNTSGSVATGRFHKRREEELLEALTSGISLDSADTRDIYPQGRQVSLERESAREEGIAASAAGRDQIENMGQSVEGLSSRDHTVCDVNGFGRGERRR